jgi:hypothetical protein
LSRRKHFKIHWIKNQDCPPICNCPGIYVMIWKYFVRKNCNFDAKCFTTKSV